MGTIARSTLTDDDGSGTTGSIWNNSEIQKIYDNIDGEVKSATNAAVTTKSVIDRVTQLLATVSKSADYTLTTADGTVLVNASGAARAMTLPTAVGAAGTTYTIKKTDSSANTVTVGTTGGQTIDGAATYIVRSQYEAVTVRSDGANWNVI